MSLEPSVSGNSLMNRFERGRNSLNAVRLILALFVMISHSFPISYGPGAEGRRDPIAIWTGSETFSSIALDFFFLISGALVTGSWFHSKSVQDYFRRRILRIYPGYIAAVSVTAVVMWTVCTDFRRSASVLAWGKDFLRDLVFLSQSSLNWPNVFDSNPLPNGANGSLWTIPIEFRCYVAVAVLGILCLFKRRVLILFAMAGAWVIYVLVLIANQEPWIRTGDSTATSWRA